ncbi:MAG: tetratricopeptide repeat protein [Candidatus Delongbacteria bacterium]|nr:tetratricopeptide repeat protein [Candidatus Delongbacteria bacterium]MBN2836141.1 tetratricopeptide repeat protein [Candidatus Delongbacteria bacterium]
MSIQIKIALTVLFLLSFDICLFSEIKEQHLVNNPDSLFVLGKKEESLENYSVAIDYYKISMAYSDTSKSEVLRRLIDLFKKIGGYDNAIDLLKENLENVDSLYYNKELFDLSFLKNDLTNTIIYGEKLLKMLKSSDEVPNVLMKMGAVYIYDEQYDAALKLFVEAESKYKISSNLHGLANTYNNIGSVYSSMERYEEALEYFNKSLAIEQDSKNYTGEAISLNNIGVTLKNLGKFDEAKDYLFQAASISDAIDDVKSLSSTLLRIAEIFSIENDLESAESVLVDASSISSDLNDNILKLDVNYQLYKLYEITGEYYKALFHYKSYNSLKDSLFGENQSKNLKNLRILYETEKKDKQIAVLDKEKEIAIIDGEKQKVYRNYILSALVFIIIIAFLIYNRYSIKNRAHKELSIAHEKLVEANREIVEKNESIMSSIRYAERIQSAILPLIERMQSKYFETSILFMPKDIVSGDFYWHSLSGEYCFIAAVDCTGHGVPGAFMSMIGNTLLNKIVNERMIYDTAEILEELNREVKQALKQDNSENSTRDGMDVSLVRINMNNNEISFTGAKRPLYIVDVDGEFEEVKGDRKSIGGIEKREKSFSITTKKPIDGDLFVLTSDGYSGQQNVDGKKIGSVYLKELLAKNHNMSVTELNKLLLSELKSHKLEAEQNDDITVICIKFGSSING